MGDRELESRIPYLANIFPPLRSEHDFAHGCSRETIQVPIQHCCVLRKPSHPPPPPPREDCSAYSEEYGT